MQKCHGCFCEIVPKWHRHDYFEPAAAPALKTLRITKKMGTSGGEGGIRTPDRLAPMPHFECGAFNHSATSPEPARVPLEGPAERAAEPTHPTPPAQERRSSSQNGGKRGVSARPEHHLGAAEGGHQFPRRFSLDPSIPNLRGATAMEEGRRAFHDRRRDHQSRG